MSIQIESDLKEILGRIEKRFDKIDEKFEKLDNKIEHLDSKIDDINIKLVKVETKLESELPAMQKTISEIKSSQQAQIWTLIGVLVTAVSGFLVAVVRFVLSSNP